MARSGLGRSWNCRFANDFDHKKSAIYRLNWPGEQLRTADIRSLTTADLPGTPDLAWGSFPCQDLSLAGGGAGLAGERSGTFYPFWELMGGLIKEGRPPRIIALENVCGALTSHDGADFASICSTFDDAGYRYGAMVIDAELFLPQSRPRLFFVGVHRSIPVSANLLQEIPLAPWHPRALRAAQQALPEKARMGWVWWKLPYPKNRSVTLSDLIEENPADARWHSPSETVALLRMMSAVNLAKVEAAKKAGRRIVGGVYKRTRRDESGRKVQRAEVRFDEVSGCLRTPAGGSSRQLLIVINGGAVKSRLITTRETARLMGLPESYTLPLNYNEGYHLTGDGVAVPVVRHIAKHLFEPMLTCALQLGKIAA